jgi:2-hydroxymuconate-semialdehyde hydrolase
VTAASLETGRLDVTGVATAIIDTQPLAPSAGPAPRQRWVDDLALSGAELASVGVPVLLVHGRDDRVVPWRASSAQLLDLIPDAQLHVLAGCGHWTMIEKTADFLAVALPFLAA